MKKLFCLKSRCAQTLSTATSSADNHKRLRQFLSLFLCLFFAAAVIKAVPGDLDPTFGTAGKVTTSFGTSFDFSSAVALQPDGKIVTAGSGRLTNASSIQFALARYNSDGTLDNTFDGDGRVLISVGQGVNVAYAVAIQPDGKIVAVGGTNVGGGDFAVLRLNPDGSPDTSFDGDGIVTTQTSFQDDTAYGVALQADGKIVVAGYGVENDNTFTIVRYNANGSLDTSFDGDGIAETTFGAVDAYGQAIVLQPNGKIVVAGYILNSGSRFALARYNSDGSLDTSFDGDGKLTTGAGPTNNISRAVALQPDGKILLTGQSGISNASVLATYRYNPDGSPDNSFGTNGLVTTTISNTNNSSNFVAYQNIGKILVGGASDGEFSLVRYNLNGTLDSSFGAGGKVTTEIMSFSADKANGIAVQPDGRIILTGETRNGTNGNDSDFAVVRYLISGSRNFDFEGDRRADVSVFRARGFNGYWYTLQSSNNSFSIIKLGRESDIIVPADYDGDRKADAAVFRSGNWYIYQSAARNFTVKTFGAPDGIPIAADYDGDGKADLAVFAQGVWSILKSSDGSQQVVPFGTATDKPLTGDYDGDGKSDLAFYRDGVWHIQGSNVGFFTAQFGLGSDKPVPMDYDGDGKTDLAVYRNGTWYLQQTTRGFAAVQFGNATDKIVPADYDGDGKADLAVYRDGEWFLLPSTGGFTTVAFGTFQDVPISSAYLP
jgi:uncharacterized delta-60 repeat protein